MTEIGERVKIIIAVTVWRVIMLCSSGLSSRVDTVELRFYEPLFNEVLGLTNNFHQPGQNYTEMYGTEPLYDKPRFNELLVMTNTIQRPTHKIYPDTTNACQECDQRRIPNRQTRVVEWAYEAVTALRNFILSVDRNGSKVKENFGARFPWWMHFTDDNKNPEEIVTERFIQLIKSPG